MYLWQGIKASSCQWQAFFLVAFVIFLGSLIFSWRISFAVLAGPDFSLISYFILFYFRFNYGNFCGKAEICINIECAHSWSCILVSCLTNCRVSVLFLVLFYALSQPSNRERVKCQKTWIAKSQNGHRHTHWDTPMHVCTQSHSHQTETKMLLCLLAIGEAVCAAHSIPMRLILWQHTWGWVQCPVSSPISWPFGFWLLYSWAVRRSPQPQFGQPSGSSWQSAEINLTTDTLTTFLFCFSADWQAGRHAGSRIGCGLYSRCRLWH